MNQRVKLYSQLLDSFILFLLDYYWTIQKRNFRSKFRVATKNRRYCVQSLLKPIWSLRQTSALK